MPRFGYGFFLSASRIAIFGTIFSVPTTNTVNTAEDTASSPVSIGVVAEGAVTYATKAGSAPAHGTVSYNQGAGTFTYTPNANFFGSDSFIIQATMGSKVKYQTVSVVVSSVNDAPVVSNASLTAYRDTAATAAIGATDVDNGSLTYATKAGAGPTNGTVTYNQGAGTYTYTPNTSYFGADSFTIVVSDGSGGTAEKIITVSVSQYLQESVTLFAAMSVEPDATRKGHIDTLITSLKTNGIWQKLDWLALLAAHDSQAARVNWINPAQVMTAVNSPAFVANQGFTSDGATSYLNSGWNPTTASSPKFTRNDCFMAVWCRTNTTGFMFDLGQRAVASINARSTSSLQTYPQSTSSGLTALPVATSVGLSAWNRTASNVTEFFKNGASIGTGTQNSVALRNASIFVLATTDNPPNETLPIHFSNRQVAMVAWGAVLTVTQHSQFYTAVNTYMTAIGAA